MDTRLKEIVERYVAAAILHGEASENGDHKRANAAYDDAIAALKEVRVAGDAGRMALLDLLSHESDSVKCWAATDLLKTDEEKAKKVLARVAKNPGVVGLDAETTLEEWRKGRLKNP